MDAEELRQEIIRIWHEIEPDIKISVAYAWEKRDELEQLQREIENTEEEILRVLEAIPNLQKDSPEYKSHVEEFIKLIKNMHPDEHWYARIRSDIEYILQELAKIKINIKERWNLQPEIKERLIELERLLREFLTAFHDYIKELAESRKDRIPTIPQSKIDDLVKIYRSYKEYHKSIADILIGRIHPDVISRGFEINTASLRDATIVCLPHEGPFLQILSDSKLRKLFDRMMILSKTKLILPKPEDRIDHNTMEFEQGGIISEHPRGTVARILRVGFIYNDEVFQRARVEFSRGPPIS